MKKIIIHHRSKHHAHNSGYGILNDYLEGETISYQTSKFPYKLAKWLSGFVSKRYGSYDTISLIKDYELSKKLLFNDEKGIVHYLNGERDIRFGIQLNQIRRKFNFIASFHKPPEVLKKTFENKYFRKLDGVIAVGENQVDFLKDWLNHINVCYIPHGVDTSFFVPDEKKKQENTILFVGQHLRDFDALNYSIPRLSELIPSLKVNVVIRKDFRKKIITHRSVKVFSGLEDHLLRNLYQEATLLFLPLKNVTACNSILEAMACGLPIISTDIGGNKGYVKNEYGILVPSKDNIALIDSTYTLLTNQELQKEMSIKASINAQEFQWDSIAAKVEFFYKSLKK